MDFEIKKYWKVQSIFIINLQIHQSVFIINLQIHLLEGGKIHVYSRNSEDNTSKYPDIIARLPHCLGDDVKSCVLDAEAVAWDAENKMILPFQVLTTRKRKVGWMSSFKIISV